MPVPGRPSRAYVIVNRKTGCVFSRHASLDAARTAWRAEAFPAPGLIKGALGKWAAQHVILAEGAAHAARRRAVEAEKRNRA